MATASARTSRWFIDASGEQRREVYEALPRVALLLPPRSAAVAGFKIKGRQLEEWAAMALADGGIETLITAPDVLEPSAVERLRRLGVTVEMLGTEFGGAGAREPLLVVSGDVTVGASDVAALTARVARLGLRAAAAAEAAPGMFALFSAAAAEEFVGADASALTAAFDAMRVCHLGYRLPVATSQSEAKRIRAYRRSLCPSPLRAVRRTALGVLAAAGGSNSAPHAGPLDIR